MTLVNPFNNGFDGPVRKPYLVINQAITRPHDIGVILDDVETYINSIIEVCPISGFHGTGNTIISFIRDTGNAIISFIRDTTREVQL